MNDEKTKEKNILEDLTVDVISYFKIPVQYAPVASEDVERSFSIYENLLSDQRRSFVLDNIKQHIIILQ